MSSFKRRSCSVQRALALSDIGFAVTSPFAALHVRNIFETGPGPGDAFLTYAISSAVATLVLLKSMGCSKAAWRFYSSGDASRAACAIASGIAVGALVSFAHDRLLCVARTVPFIQALFQVAVFVGVRILARALSNSDRKRDEKAQQVLVVGCNSMSLTYMHAIRELSNGSIAVAGFLTENRILVGQTIHGKRVLGTIAEASDVIGTLQVHGIQISRLAMAPGPNGFALQDARALDTARERYALLSVNVPSALAAFSVSECVPDAEPVVEPAAWKPLYGLVKRTIDLTGATLLLLALSPLMLLVCAVVALDVGFPILFWQQRLGMEGKRLTVYKFRTMRAPLDSAGRRISDAKRVSLVGHWLRKLRIDELPQLISVLKGDMSFVGPRPLLPIDQPIDARRRLSVKPGLTGWAQVHGGNLVAIEDKNALDLWYVAHSNLLLDLEIALRTIRMLFHGDNLDDGKIEQAKRWMHGFDFVAGS